MKKSKRAGFSKHLKSLGVLFTVALISISCGKNNSSGKSSNTTGVNGYGTGIYNYPGYGTQYGNYTLEQIMNIIVQENPCYNDQTGQFDPSLQRQRGQQALNTNVNIASAFVGVTSYGDIAVVQNQGQPVADLWICPRSAATGQGQVYGQTLVVSQSQNCVVGEIDRLNGFLGMQGGQVSINFRPIAYGNGSQLCQNF